MKKTLYKIWKNTVLFYLGGMCYICLELLWRGWSHGAMFPVGGICFLLIGHIDSFLPGLPQFPRAVLGAILVTLVELVSGVFLNLYLGLHIWDYGAMAYNLLGQICPAFFFLWFFVSGAANLLDLGLRRVLFGEKRTLSPLI